MTHYPRVLVLAGDEITADFSTGITVVNLLREWPTDRLAQICMVPSTGDGERLTERTVALPANGGVLDLPIRWGLRWVRTARSLVARRRTGPNTAVDDVPPPTGDLARPHAALAALLELGPVRLSPAAKTLVRDFRPDVIYAPMSGIRMMRLARHLSRISGAPLVPHFLDDWPSTLFQEGELGGGARRTLLAELHQTLAAAAGLGVISTAMATEYEHRYGVHAVPLMNCIETFDEPKNPATGTAGPTRFAYVGGLHLGRAALLLEVARAIESTPQATLIVHAPREDLDHFGAAFTGIRSVQWGPSLPVTDVHTALASADVLVHLESFAEATIRYTRLSISTKIPQYLAAARPIFAVGPREVASIQHLRQSGAAVVVDRVTGPSLGAAVKQLTDDPAGRESLAELAVAFAAKNHYGPTVRERLLHLLRQAADTPRTAERLGIYGVSHH